LKIYFARHGESEANVLAVISNRGRVHGLTEKGREQARTLAEKLSGVHVTAIWSSPLLRATQTADILSAALDVGYEVTDALREYDCGVLEGKSDAESWRIHRAVMAGWINGARESTIEGAETYADVERRFVPFVRGLLKQHGASADNCILIGHGGLYVTMLPLVLSNVPVGSTAGLSFPNTGYVLAETRGDQLVGVEWCGVSLPA
jgi:broad specificity phosphatase PhoE